LTEVVVLGWPGGGHAPALVGTGVEGIWLLVTVPGPGVTGLLAPGLVVTGLEAPGLVVTVPGLGVTGVLAPGLVVIWPGVGGLVTQVGVTACGGVLSCPAAARAGTAIAAPPTATAPASSNTCRVRNPAPRFGASSLIDDAVTGTHAAGATPGCHPLR
jgi:hypothetical protein